MQHRRAVRTLIGAVLACAVVLSLPTVTGAQQGPPSSDTTDEPTTTAEPTTAPPPTAPTTTAAPTTTTTAPPTTPAPTTTVPPATTILPSTTESTTTTTIPTTTTAPPSLSITSTTRVLEFEGGTLGNQKTPDLTNLLRIWAASIVIVFGIMGWSWWTNRP